MEHESDAELMHRVAGGDEIAMAELVARWERPVLSFVFRFLSCSEDDARDLAQDVFLRVWRRRRKWRPTASFSTWLFTITGNLCRNRKRDLHRRPGMVPASMEPAERSGYWEVPSSADDPHARAVANQTSMAVREAVGRLPEAQRTAVLLRHFGELTYREIATVMGTSPTAVDSLLVRARRTLARLILDSAQETERYGVQQ
jgi:RNA polymerase sigma-70 factor (ECF subfamily)